MAKVKEEILSVFDSTNFNHKALLPKAEGRGFVLLG